MKVFERELVTHNIIENDVLYLNSDEYGKLLSLIPEEYRDSISYRQLKIKIEDDNDNFVYYYDIKRS